LYEQTDGPLMSVARHRASHRQQPGRVRDRDGTSIAPRPLRFTYCTRAPGYGTRHLGPAEQGNWRRTRFQSGLRHAGPDELRAKSPLHQRATALGAGVSALRKPLSTVEGMFNVFRGIGWVGSLAAVAFLTFPGGPAMAQHPPDEAALDAVIHAYAVCMDDHVIAGDYSVSDGVSSAISLMAKCRPEWKAYVKDCVSSGRDPDVCASLSVGLAESTIDLGGRDLQTRRRR
jgi:hypothetical protein